MPLDTLNRATVAQDTLWFILADHANAPDLEEALDLLSPHLLQTESSTSVLVLPRHAAAGVPQNLGIDAVNATHGSRIEPASVHVLPPDRLFVLDGDVLQLRPRDLAHHISPCGHLVPSLARRYGSGLHVLALGDVPEADQHVLNAARAFGATIVTLEVLRRERQHAEEVSPAPPAPMSATLPGQLAHDLRQPLQTATLLQGLLARQVEEPRLRELVARLGDTLKNMTDMIAHPAGVPASLPVSPPEPADVSDGPILTVGGTPATVYIIDDDQSVREALRAVLEDEGCEVEDFERCEDFLENAAGETDGCLLVDAYLPGMSGMELLNRLRESGSTLPAIMITGSSDVQTAVRAMKAGAADFIEKPVSAAELLAGVRQALARERDVSIDSETRERATQCLQALTKRQKQIMAMVLDGHPSKIIAADLGISQRTVENHRAAIMKKTGSRSLPALARLAIALQPHLSSSAAN